MNMKRWPVLLLFIAIPANIISLTCPEIWATNHAVLIGVGAYSNLAPAEHLEGPPYDVKALYRLLTGVWEFKPEEITTLVNEQATREAILRSMEKLERTSKPGDFLFIYFSGHGTSSYDPDAQSLGIGPSTGALVPADFKRGTPDEMRGQLIIGTRDLRPILEKLEQGRKVLVAFDSCYSGDTVRTVLQTGKSKYLPIQWEDLIDEPLGSYGGNTLKEPPYPYRNVVYISASSRLERAEDIPKSFIDSGLRSTIDGWPHGAMTDALLRALGGAADTNNDGKVNCNELYYYVRNEVCRSFPHTPQLLYAKSNSDLLDQPFFTHKSIRLKPHPGLVNPATPLRVKLGETHPDLQAKIRRIPRVKLVENDYDVLITEAQGMYRIYLANGFPLVTLPGKETDKIINRLNRQVMIKDLVGFSLPDQPFNVFLELSGEGGVLAEGEAVGFKLKAEQESYILLIDIDPMGFINVLYPGNREELAPLPAGQDLVLADLGQVVAPFGTEYLKVFAFKSKPANIDRITGSQFWPSDRRLLDLMDIIKAAGRDLAQLTLQVKTCAADDIAPGN